MAGTDLPLCPTDGGPVTGCCLVAIPNTSSWAVACPQTAGAPQTVPTLDLTASIVLAGLLALAGGVLAKGRP